MEWFYEARYAPDEKPAPVVGGKEFMFAAVGLEHNHIYGICSGLTEAGAALKYVYDPDESKMGELLKQYPGAKAAGCLDEILRDGEVRLVASDAVPSERCALGLRVMDAGKDFFSDKAPMTTLEQLELAKAKVRETGKKYMVYYSERLHVEGAVYAGQLVRRGEIGRVIQVVGLGPHRLNAPSRPDWFFERERYGGILCDIGSHQIEQFLYYCGVKDAAVVRSQAGNYSNPEHPGLEDFGEAMLVGDNGSTQYFRVDWFTPDGLRTWGDGRTILLGTDGYLEIRKYIDVAREATGDHVILVNRDGERHFSVAGKVGYPFFGQLILDCIHRTENAMTQEHAFKAAELCLKAQMQAVRIQ